jgi:penicillin-binding protein 2
VFAFRFWYLQVHRGEHFAQKAHENRLRIESTYAPRGLIRDRDGELIANNEPSYALAVIREDVADLDATLAMVSEWTGEPMGQLREAYSRTRLKTKSFEPMVLVSDLSFELLAVIEANAPRWPGLRIVTRPRRSYPQGPELAHILGYVAEASETDLSADQELSMGDMVGKQGLEYFLERRLRGEKGVRQLEVDVVGRRLNQKDLKKPRAGNQVTLSIDLDLQEFIIQEMRSRDYAGGVVVMEPFTGQVLALVSEPTFDNNAFTSGLTPEQWTRLRDDPRHPLQNRVTQGVYPPGSVFKLVVAACALHEGMMDTSETVWCPGYARLGTHVFRCWKRGGHGHVDLEQAVAQSCDVYFYELGKRLGVDRIEAFSKACGFGELTGIDLHHEKPGLIPSREWKRRRFGERWQGGENFNLAIGQGFTLVTPLQVARFMGSLLNGGKLMKPLLVTSAEPEVQGEIPLDSAHVRRVLAYMRETVEGQRGTAKKILTEGAVTGGKTGTAQVIKLTEEHRKAELEDIPYKFRDHGWLASWGVKDGKMVVVVVMIEHGGGGSSAAGPVSRAIYEYLYRSEDGAPLANWPHVVESLPEIFQAKEPDDDKGAS